MPNNELRRMTINGIIVNAPADSDMEELLAYVDKYKQQYLTLSELTIKFEGDFANVWVHTANKPFERIRRITGQPD